LNSEKHRRTHPEVLHSDEALTTVDRSDVSGLKTMARANARGRMRLCAHETPEDALHEMLIVHDRSVYVRPHKHPGKTESMHIVEGLVDVVLFDDEGKIERIVRMGDYASGHVFYYRMTTPVFHTLLIRSETVVFLETTSGPFDRSETVFADWAPDDGEAAASFLAELTTRVSTFA
jgi:cupin fold WbuC family metalloprotein